MIMNETKSNNRGKLLAAIAIIAMVLCVFAVAIPADDTQGVPAADSDYTDLGVKVPGEGVTTVNTFDELKAELDKGTTTISLVAPTGATTNSPAEIVIDEPVEVKSTTTLYIAGATFSDYNNTDSNLKVTIADDVTVTISGTVYVNGGTSAREFVLSVNGDIVMNAGGEIYLTAAPTFGANASVSGFFTSFGGKWTNYKQAYAGTITDLVSNVKDSTYSDCNVAEKRIYAYGNLAISEAVSASEITLVVGGVSGAAS